MTEKKKNGSGGKTRREFLKDAGLLVGGTAIGSTVLLAACGGEETTKTVTAPGGTTTVTAPGGTTTVTAAATTITDTTTVTAGAGATVTDTVTESKFVCPSCGMEFDTLTALQAHFTAEHAEAEAIPGIISLNVNDEIYNVTVNNEDTLAFAIREKCLLPGTKIGCNRGACGTCTVLVDGKPMYSCMLLAIQCQGKKIETVEGIGSPRNLSPVQQKFVDNKALQCGFCTPGFLMTATALLRNNPNPTRQEVKEAIAGHFCYCGTMTRVVKSITEAGGA